MNKCGSIDQSIYRSIDRSKLSNSLWFTGLSCLYLFLSLSLSLTDFVDPQSSGSCLQFKQQPTTTIDNGNQRFIRFTKITLRDHWNSMKFFCNLILVFFTNALPVCVYVCGGRLWCFDIARIKKKKERKNLSITTIKTAAAVKRRNNHWAIPEFSVWEDAQFAIPIILQDASHNQQKKI